jgi:hypothetical protein
MRTLVVLALLVPATALAQRPATGPLRVLKTNPRWFTDGSGKAVYLTGSHAWWVLQDNGVLLRDKNGDPVTGDPPRFDFDGYLRFMRRHNHNFFRMWRWELPTMPVPPYYRTRSEPEMQNAHPHPWLRAGPGTARDGKPKFDLARYDPAYFDRLRKRLQAAGAQGIYAAVMLFEGWETHSVDGWRYHPFHAANNVNDVEADADGDGKGLEYVTIVHTPMGARVLELQKAYVRKVIDTVNDLDNVLYEIANEAGGRSTAWQYHLIDLINEYQRGKPKQHLVGMTYAYPGGVNTDLYNSPADWISPNPGTDKESFRDNPCGDCTNKIVVNDTDHLWGHTGGDAVWVWKSFTRGLHPLFMEDLSPSPTWQDSARLGMGQTRRYAERMNLAAMTPDQKVASSRFCLAHRGQEYLVFQADRGEFTVDLTDAPGTFRAEWLDVHRDRVVPARPVQGGKVVRFPTPFPGPSALYLKLQERR